MRLDKLLSNLGYCSRREADRYARDGVVLVSGKQVRLANIEVDPNTVTFDGEELDPGPGMVIMLHKPIGYTCSHKDHGELVMDLLPPRFSQRKPPLAMVGRLDRETSGLLLLTDDGQLLHRLTSPKHHVSKIYRVSLRDPLAGNESEIFASGTMILAEEETPLLPRAFP